MLLLIQFQKYLAKNKASINNSIHIYVLSMWQLIAKLVEKFGGDMIALLSPEGINISVQIMC